MSAWRAALVAVVEVVDVVVIEIDRLLHEPKSEGTHAEIEIRLRLVDGRGHMVKAEDWERHQHMVRERQPFA